jgi:uncharacterized coiled-coil protein SlyX
MVLVGAMGNEGIGLRAPRLARPVPSGPYTGPMPDNPPHKPPDNPSHEPAQGPPQGSSSEPPAGGPDRITRLEEGLAFAEHTVEQLSRELLAANRRADDLARRVEKLEGRLREMAEAQEQPPESPGP